MSAKYHAMTSAAQEWLSARLLTCDPVTITDAQYRRGVDALPDDLRAIARQCFDEFLVTHSYELSYSQLCNALFTAAESLGIIRRA